MSLLVPAISVITMTVAACLAVIGYRFSRLPGWRDQRWFAWVLASASLYAAFDIVVTLDVPAWVGLLGARGSWVALSLHALAWTLHSAAYFHTAPTRTERVLLGSVVAVAILALIPGVLMHEPLVTHHFLGITYREPPPTLLGSLCAVPLYATLVAPLSRFVRAARTDVDARRYAAALSLLAVFGANDLVVSSGAYELPYLLDLGFLAVSIVIGGVLTERFTEATYRLDVLSSQLEVIASERTRELAKAHEALGQAERLAAIGRLSAGVAHEINNPSAAVVSNLSYLKAALAAGKVPGDANEALNDSLASMAQIARIVRQLLDTGRVAGSESSMRSAFDLALAVANAAQTARAALDRSVEIDVNVPPIFGVGDQLMIEQVLVNLIVNGAQAVPETRVPHLSIEAEALPAGVRVAVTDNGTGMSEDVARRAFEPFFSTKAFGKGTGLGLSVSLGLAKAMGGDLRVARTSELGTTLELSIRSSLRISSAPPPAAAPLARPAQRLLLVDDDPIVRDGLSRMLSRTFEVVTANGVRDAMRSVGSTHFDAILCDVMMDDGGGEAFYSWLQRERPSTAPRVIFLTGGVTDESSRKFLDAQDQPVLYKPVDLVTVERAVDEVCA